MARKTVVIHTDDLGGPGIATPTTIVLNGEKVTIDLNKRNQAILARSLKKYFDAGNGVTPVNNKEIRIWAERNGISLGERGRISAKVRDAFIASQQ